MLNKLTKLILLLISCLLGLLSCTKTELGAYDINQGSNAEFAQISVSINKTLIIPTKSTLLETCESMGSGACILCFDGQSGELLQIASITQAQIDAQSSIPITLSLPMKSDMDFYVLGNLNYISRTDPTVYADISTALGEALPMRSSDLENYIYRLDGGVVNSKYRRETFAEVAKYGIPYVTILKGQNIINLCKGSSSLSFECKRLFCRIDLTVDCASLTGGTANYFADAKLYARGVNNKLMPFSAESQKASSIEDILVQSDYDANITSANTLEFSLYLPENMQGTLLPGNEDNLTKNPEALAAAGHSSLLDYLSYIEFSGKVDTSAGGYGGDMTYRFYLGRDATGNFDLERNHDYKVKLSFYAGSLLNPTIPEWKVEGDVDDTRIFSLSEDEQGTKLLPDGQNVVVRPNRPGRFYVYMNPEAQSGNNMLRGKTIRDPEYKVESLVDCAWTSDFKTETNKLAQVPGYVQLANYGIEANYNPTNAMLSFEVVNPAKFEVGKSVNLHIRLLPGDKTLSFNILTYPDMAISWDKSVSEGFYPGMKRVATLSGFYGYLDYKMTDPHMYKYDYSDNATHIIQSSYGVCPKIEFSKSTYQGSKEFKLYNYYYCTRDIYQLYFLSDDSFNDGVDPLVVGIKNTYPEISTNAASYELDMRGTEVDYYIVVKDEHNNTIPISDFDSIVYKHVYTPHLSVIENHYQQIFDPVTQGEVYSAQSEDEYLHTELTNRTTADGYPIFRMWRKKLGTRYTLKSDKNSQYKLCSLVCMPCWCGERSYKIMKNISICFMPLVNNGYGPQFAQKYQDWTLYDEAKLKSQYRALDQASIPAAEGKNLQLYLPSLDGVDYYAKPTNPESYSTTLGHSPNIRLTQVANGSMINMSILDVEDDETLMHSVGPHDAYVAVTNKHSSEKVELKIGSFEVYANIYVGGRYKMSSFYLTNYSSSYAVIDVYPTIYGDTGRISARSDVFESIMMYDGGTQPLALLSGGEVKMYASFDGCYAPFISNARPDYEEVEDYPRIWSVRYTPVNEEAMNDYIVLQMCSGDASSFVQQIPCLFQFYKDGAGVDNIDCVIGTLKDTEDKGYIIFHRMIDVANTQNWN